MAGRKLALRARENERSDVYIRTNGLSIYQAAAAVSANAILPF